MDRSRPPWPSSSTSASPGSSDRRRSSPRDTGFARACGRHAQPARTAAGARLPRTAEKHSHSGAQPSHLPVGSVA